MKIVKLETFTKPYVSFVKITVEDGSIGYGQMSTYHADITCLLYTSPSPRDKRQSRMPSSA